jgi:hypothetical protein
MKFRNEGRLKAGAMGTPPKSNIVLVKKTKFVEPIINHQ